MRDSPGCFLAFVPCSPALSIVIGESGANFESRRGLMLPNTFPQAHFFNTILHSPVVFLLSGFTSFLKPFNRLCYKPSLQARRSLSQPPLSKSTNRYFFLFFFWYKQHSSDRSDSRSYIFTLFLNVQSNVINNIPCLILIYSSETISSEPRFNPFYLIHTPFAHLQLSTFPRRSN